jgi:hypothetical protein
VQVSPGAPKLLPARALPALPYVGDWVVEPRSGDLLTVAARGGRAQLIRLAAGATRPALTPLPAVLPGRSAYGGLALHPDGTLTALFNQSAGPGAGPGTGHAPGGSALFRIPLAHPERAAKVADLGSVTSSDATTCPVPAPPAIAAVPPVVVPAPSEPVAGIAAAPATSAPAPSPVVVPATAAPVPVPAPPAPRPRAQVRRATPPPPASTAAAPPVAAPSRRSNVHPAPVTVAAPTRTPIGKRFIPVAGGFMLAAVAMTRLFRRRRRA